MRLASDLPPRGEETHPKEREAEQDDASKAKARLGVAEPRERRAEEKHARHGEGEVGVDGAQGVGRDEHVGEEARLGEGKLKGVAEGEGRGDVPRLRGVR